MPELNYNYKTNCPHCGRPQEVNLNIADFFNWQNGELAQNAFPYLSADQREILMTGICPKCWDDMFK